MPYTDQAALVDRYGEQELVQVTDKGELLTGEINSTVVSRALADADAIIESYVGARYVVPMAPVPAVVVEKACVIARYKLHEDHASELIRKDYESAIAWLRDVAAGRAVIVGAVVPGSTSDGNFSAVAVGAPVGVFSGDVLEAMP